MRLREFDTSSPSLFWLQVDERIASIFLRRQPGEDYMHIGVEWVLAPLVGAAGLVRCSLGWIFGDSRASWADPEIAVWWIFAALVFAAATFHSIQNRRLRRMQQERSPTRFVGYSIFLNRRAFRRAPSEVERLRVIRRSYWVEFAFLAAVAAAFCTADLWAFGLYLVVVAFVLLNNGVLIVGRRLQERKEILNAMYFKERQVALLREIDGGRSGLADSVIVK